MKKMISKLMVMCFLAVSLAAFAQSDDNMKKGDSMKHDDMKQDQMKNDNMSNDKKSTKTNKKTKKSATKTNDNMKNDSMKSNDNMKHDDTNEAELATAALSGRGHSGRECFNRRQR